VEGAVVNSLLLFRQGLKRACAAGALMPLAIDDPSSGLFANLRPANQTPITDIVGVGVGARGYPRVMSETRGDSELRTRAQQGQCNSTTREWGYIGDIN